MIPVLSSCRSATRVLRKKKIQGVEGGESLIRGGGGGGLWGGGGEVGGGGGGGGGGEGGGGAAMARVGTETGMNLLWRGKKEKGT